MQVETATQEGIKANRALTEPICVLPVNLLFSKVPGGCTGAAF